MRKILELETEGQYQEGRLDQMVGAGERWIAAAVLLHPHPRSAD